MFSNQTVYLYFYIVGRGKTGPAHSFPPPKCFDLSIYCLVFRFMFLFDCIWTTLNEQFQRENQVFKPTSLLVLLHFGVGKDWAGPFFTPSKMFRSFYLSSSLFDSFGFCFSFAVSELFWLIPSRESSFQTKQFICLSTLLGGERLGRPILSPSKMFWSFYLSFNLWVYVTLWLYLNNFEWPIPKRDQVFKPTSLWVLLHCGVGKDRASPIFPPSKLFWSFYLSYSLFHSLDYVTLSLYLNFFWLIPSRESSFQTKQFICTSTLWGGERLGWSILSPLQND